MARSHLAGGGRRLWDCGAAGFSRDPNGGRRLYNSPRGRFLSVRGANWIEFRKCKVVITNMVEQDGISVAFWERFCC